MSTAETNKVKAKLAALISSFDDLEAQLEPLFAQTLPETLVGLEPLQQAKLQTVLPYLVYDLIFIYLKSKGIDPRTHPVIGELDRIRQYFDKISNAENPPTKRVEVDKAAASRFIKHAIAQSQMQWKKTAAEDMQTQSETAAGPSTTTGRVPVKVTQKMRDRAEYEAKLKASAANGAGVKEEEEEGLQVFDEDEDVKGGGMDVEQDQGEVALRKAKGKGKATDASSTSTPQVEETAARSTGAKRRQPMDPFAGYGDDAAPSGSPAPSATAKKAKSSPAPSSTAASPSGTPGPKKTKKKSKKSATVAS